MANEMQIAGVSVPPGKAIRHSIEFVELADGTRVSLPLLLVNGASDGPRFYIGAGLHGDEVGGIAILSRVLGHLQPESLAGSIVCVLVQNPLAFQVEHRLPIGLYIKSPLDQMPVDAMMTFPGNPNGNMTENLSHMLFQLIKTCDYAIDIHTPTHGGRYPPIAILPHPSLGDAYKRTEELADAFGCGYIMKSNEGTYVQDGILCVEATRVGVPTFTFEIGEGGRLEDDMIEEGVRCVLNALRYAKIMPGEIQPPRETVNMTRFVGLRASRGGILQTRVGLGAKVKKGDILAQIYNVYGDEVEVTRAPTDGILIRMTTFPTVSTGERVATLGV